MNEHYGENGCPLCIGGQEDQITIMLDGVGVTGAARAAVHEILAPCEPDEHCIQTMKSAVMAAAAKIDIECIGRVHDVIRCAAALLAVLECLDEQPLRNIAVGMHDTCAGRCGRQGPGGKKWKKAMTACRQELIGADEGRVLVLEAVMSQGRPLLQAVHTMVEEGDGSNRAECPCAILTPAAAGAAISDFSARILRLCQLAIVKKVGPKMGPGRRGKGPLRVRGLRIRGDTQAWSAFHNAVVDNKVIPATSLHASR